MTRGLGVYAPMALLPNIIIEKLREKCEPDIYRTSCLMLKAVSDGNIIYRFEISGSTKAAVLRGTAIEVAACELTEGEQTVIDTIIKITATSALKKI